jgi:hypothetical protein
MELLDADTDRRRRWEGHHHLLCVVSGRIICGRSCRREATKRQPQSARGRKAKASRVRRIGALRRTPGASASRCRSPDLLVMKGSGVRVSPSALRSPRKVPTLSAIRPRSGSELCPGIGPRFGCLRVAAGCSNWDAAVVPGVRLHERKRLQTRSSGRVDGGPAALPTAAERSRCRDNLATKGY